MIRFCTLFLMVTSIMTLLTVIDGSCHIEPSHIMNLGSKVVTVCEHNHMDYMEGSKIITPDCFECTCTKNGLTCCGFGIRAGQISVPRGYKLVEYGCDFEIVRDGN